MAAGRDPYWLTLTGVNGCGKTHLMRQVFTESRRLNPGNASINPIWPPDWQNWHSGSVYPKHRPCCLYFDERRIAERMRAGEFDLPQSLRDDHFVAIDELGVSRDPTNFVSASVGQVVENRINRWSMFATNFTMPEIAERMDARISSRLIRDENVVIVIKAGDYALHSV